ncbi:hypothetical protein QEH56_11315 [Pelagicoccus enzymogenes]|uniref:glycoside hydrolase family 78 protein n=1 Tax=Pelagicoccus enzymogenes TaxID=2773457 RepID=UPI00280D5F0D|nr:hypothetical protein [Pelagicoccus enzymogenes]MDQ8198743.1 hypothetical protein [Pelagicoccus enzymogenes]
MTIENRTTNARTNPLGIPADDISFAWTLSSSERGNSQSAYAIRASKANGETIWSSG